MNDHEMIWQEIKSFIVGYELEDKIEKFLIYNWLNLLQYNCMKIVFVVKKQFFISKCNI